MSGRREQRYFDCPYCMARIATFVDVRAGPSQSFRQDCAVCRRPIVIHVALEHGRVIGFAAEQDA